MLINFVDATNDANHYTKLPPMHLIQSDSVFVFLSAASRLELCVHHFTLLAGFVND